MMPTLRNVRWSWRWVTYLLLAVAAVFYLGPVYLVVVTALKEPAEIRLSTAWHLPEVWHWQSFAVAWEAFGPGLRNSLVLAVTATVISALLGSLNGYVLSKWRFPGANIVFPLSIAGFVVVIIWQFTQIWNEFLFAVTLTRRASAPITVALAQLAGGEAVRWNLPMAGAILAAIPTLIIYIILGRYFIRGLLAGSVKG